MLHEFTGHDEVYWFGRVQHLIGANTKTKEGEAHGRTNARAWMRALTTEILKSFPTKGEPYDGNMRLAVCMGLVLAHWYARIHHAKMMDPRRPLAIRRTVYPRWIAVAQAYQAVFLDESKDNVILKGQPWNNPFWPNARGGKFV